MANAYKDENGVSTIIGALNTDGSTIVRVLADPSTHVLNVNDGTTGTDYGPVNDLKDANGVNCLMAVSSVDGVTPVVLYVDSNGALLTDSS